jgi:uncharacterized membrane protein
VPNIHPVFTHFPIAFFTLGLLFDLLAVSIRSSRLEQVGWWLQLSGSVGLAGTIISGLIAESTILIPGQATSTFESHEQIAFVVAALAALLLLWRISSRMLLPSRMKPLYLSALTFMVIIMWVGAWYGGELVYSFGTGVQLIR